jgi:hypothetical protein
MSSTTGGRLAIGLVALAALGVRVAFALSLPAFQAPDEEAHLRYVTHLRENRELPVQPPLAIDLFANPMHQAYQPPLAYLAFLPVDGLLTASGAALPTRLRALRIQNACYGVATVLVGALLAARLTRRGDPRRLLVAALLAFLPGFVAVGSAVNNDSLAILLAAALWLTLLPAEGRRRSPWWAGIALGAACLAKLSSLVLAPMLLAVPLLADRRDLRGAVRFAVPALALAALVMAPWLLRNASVYGNPLAIGVGSLAFDWLATLVSEEQLAPLMRPRFDNAFFQFWGRFGIANNLSFGGVPWVLVPLFLASVVGWLRGRRGSARDSLVDASPAFALALLLAGAGLVGFSLEYAGAWQGRYLYGALLPVAVLFAGGFAALLPEAQRRRGALAVAALLFALDVVTLLVLRRFFASHSPSDWIHFTRL